MEFRCSYCKYLIGIDQKGKEEGISDGICPECWPFIQAEMAEYKLSGKHGHLMKGGKRKRTKETLNYVI